MPTINLLSGAELQKEDRCYQSKDPLILSLPALRDTLLATPTIFAQFVADRNYLITFAEASILGESQRQSFGLVKRQSAAPTPDVFVNGFGGPFPFTDAFIVLAMTHDTFADSAPGYSVFQPVDNRVYITKGTVLEFVGQSFPAPGTANVTGRIHLLPTFT